MITADLEEVMEVIERIIKERNQARHEAKWWRETYRREMGLDDEEVTPLPWKEATND